jgi:arylsulfatase A-like enzyme
VPPGQKRQVSTALCLLALLNCAGCTRPAVPGQDKLNVVIVLSDALRAANLPLYGYPRDTAPHLTELARQSIVFDHHFAHYPGTSVSISQLYTGRLMSPLLMSYKYIAVPVRALPTDLLILPREFGAAGYRTGIISSHYWLRGNDSRLLRYFDHRAIVPAHGDQSYAFFEDLWPEVTAFLDEGRQDRRPFFLYLHTLDTHGPNTYHPGFEQFRAAAGWPEAYNTYDSEILYTDYWVGKLVDELRRRGLWERTIFVFTGDHGDEFNEMGPQRWNSNHGPLVRRSLMHVPLLMHIPGAGAAARRYQGVTRHIDLAPTLLRLAVPNCDLRPFRVDGDDLGPELLHGGDGRSSHRLSVAYSPRYWGLFGADVELHYDQWSDTFSPLYRPVPDAHNYPRLQPIDDPSRRATWIKELHHTYETRVREFIDLPPNEALPSPALLSLLVPVMQVAHGKDSSGPVFETVPDDNRWSLDASALRAQVSEHPGPLTISTPWVPGTYRVSVLLYKPAIRDGYQNQFQIHFGDSGTPPVSLRGTDANADNRLDAGVQTIGKEMAIQFSAPQGGVAIAGLRLERLGVAAPSVTPDDLLKDRLRALGYVD